MRNLSVRRRAATVLGLLGTAFLYHIPAIAAGSIDDTILQSIGEFELGNGDTKIVVNSKVPEPYRVCVSKGADAVPVKVRYDGAEQLVAVGNCTDVTGKFIRLSAGGRLKDGEVLIGKFEHLKTKS